MTVELGITLPDDVYGKNISVEFTKIIDVISDILSF